MGWIETARQYMQTLQQNNDTMNVDNDDSEEAETGDNIKNSGDNNCKFAFYFEYSVLLIDNY